MICKPTGKPSKEGGVPLLGIAKPHGTDDDDAGAEEEDPSF
jgi:hypothetical protein